MSVPCDLSKMIPKDARLGFRNNVRVLQGISCSQLSAGYVQANIVCVPSNMADDFEEYCRLNSAPCPLLCRSKPGEVSVPTLADNVDVRTDLPFYSLGKYDDFKLVENLLDVPWEEMVTFYIGCSFSFDYALQLANIPLHHLILNQCPAVYCVGIPCHPVRSFSGHMLVSMRSLPRGLIQRAVEVTAPLDFCHGAPIHIGDPGLIGIHDVSKQEYGGPPVAPTNEVPLFWGCGMTGFQAVLSAKPPVSVSLGHGCSSSLLITDHLTEDYMRMPCAHTCGGGPLNPRVVFLTEAPLFASIASQQALKEIQNLQPLDEAITTPLPDQVDAMSRTALRLSHASSVAIVTGWGHRPLNEACSSLSLMKALSALGKNVVLIATDANDVSTWRELIGRSVDEGVINRHVAQVIQVSDKASRDNLNASICAPPPNLQSTLDLIVESQEGILGAVSAFPGKESVAKQMTSEGCRGDSSSGQSVGTRLDGNSLALALFVLHQCPVHSRYLRHGLGEHKVVSVDDLLVTPTQVERCISSDTFPKQADSRIEEAWSLMQRNYDVGLRWFSK